MISGGFSVQAATQRTQRVCLLVLLCVCGSWFFLGLGLSLCVRGCSFLVVFIHWLRGQPARPKGSVWFLVLVLGLHFLGRCRRQLWSFFFLWVFFCLMVSRRPC